MNWEHVSREGGLGPVRHLLTAKASLSAGLIGLWCRCLISLAAVHDDFLELREVTLVLPAAHPFPLIIWESFL